MNSISKLISLLGGTGAVAKKLNIQPSAISNWKKLNKIPSINHILMCLHFKAKNFERVHLKKSMPPQRN